jgi:dienelactone hydrolase
MAEIVLFHSVLGLRPGVLDAAERLRSAGHVVHTPDLYDGEVFDDYESAFQWLDGFGGIPKLIERTYAAVAELPADLVYAGFSNGGASAALLAATRPGARAALLFHAAMPLEVLGVDSWPPDVPVQVHYAANDPFRQEGALTAFATAVQASGAPYEFFEYPVTGHLITDETLPAEYDKDATEALFTHVLRFMARLR